MGTPTRTSSADHAAVGTPWHLDMADGHSTVEFRMVSSLVVQKGTDQIVIGTCSVGIRFDSNELMVVYTCLYSANFTC